MNRIKKTYRLSEESISLIDQRDKVKYPTASEFIEKTLIEKSEQLSLEQIHYELSEIRKLQEKILDMIEKKSDKAENDGISDLKKFFKER